MQVRPWDRGETEAIDLAGDGRHAQPDVTRISPWLEIRNPHYSQTAGRTDLLLGAEQTALMVLLFRVDDKAAIRYTITFRILRGAGRKSS